MKLTNYTSEQLMLIVNGMFNQINFIDPMDEQYNINYEITECDKYQFKFTIFWNLGCDEQDEERVISDNNFFIINKNDTMRKFVTEVNDLIDEITEKPFDSELSDDEFNQLNND